MEAGVATVVVITMATTATIITTTVAIQAGAVWLIREIILPEDLPMQAEDHLMQEAVV